MIRKQNMLGMGIAAVLATTALAQGSNPQDEPSIKAAVEDIKWSIQEDFGYYTFDGGEDLLAFDTTFALSLNEGTEVFVSVPVYNQGDETSIANLAVGGQFVAADGTNPVFGEWDLALGGGVYLPVGSETFDSANVDPFFTGEFGCKVWVFDFTQTAEFRFVGGGAYMPWLGAKTDSDVLTLGTNLGHKWGDFGLAAELTQIYYIDANEEQVFLGPVVSWNPSSSVSIEAKVDFPVTQNTSTPETDMIVGIGLGIKF
jgi:hypothetical protein